MVIKEQGIKINFQLKFNFIRVFFPFDKFNKSIILSIKFYGIIIYLFIYFCGWGTRFAKAVGITLRVNKSRRLNVCVKNIFLH